VRRRCSPLTRLLLRVAHDCGNVADTPTVFASRHGDCAGGVELMGAIARGEALTANSFSHSVHNAPAGLYSIVGENRQPSTSMAGSDGTFSTAVIEALGVLRRSETGRVLLVVGDAPVPAIFGRFVREPSAPYAVALLLARAGDGPRVCLARGDAPDPCPTWPDAVEFVRWHLSAEPSAAIGRGRNRLEVRRVG
jgi:hypothetical protein